MAKTEQRICRLPREAVIAGVASGFARYFRMDVTLMRLIFIGVFLLTQGAAVVAYIVLLFILPTQEKPHKSSANFSEKVETLAEEMKTSGRIYSLSTYLGIAVIACGVWLLTRQFFPQLIDIQWHIVWPVLIIGLGALIIVRSRNRE